MTTQGFRCAVNHCPMLRQDGIRRERCPEPEMLCEYVRCSIDPEDMPSFEEWVAQHDPTHGRIDRDVQREVDQMNPTSLGQRVALENTLQSQRDGRWTTR